jgi:cupin 2 domain-containing protein
VSARYLRGRLRDASEAPATGEETERLLELGDVLIEQILSGTLEAPADYRQPQDEWVLVLSGRARLELDGELVELEGREWLFLPAGLPHRLLETEPGTDWLAVHVHPGARGET